MKKILISAITFVVITVVTINVFASTTGKINLNANSKEIKAGEEITVTLSASDSNTLNTVEYTKITVTDKNGKTTSEISVKNVEKTGDWAEFEYDGKKAFVYSGAATNSAEVCKITFKASDKIESGEYNINIEGLTVYSTNIEDDTTTIGTKSIKIEVKAEEIKGDDPENSKDENKDEEKEDTSKDENKDEEKEDTSKEENKDEEKEDIIRDEEKEDTNKKDNTIYEGTKHPNTGLGHVIIISTIIIGIVSVVSYKSYRKYTDIK